MKRYNLKLIDIDTKETIHEIELKVTRMKKAGCFIDNPIHTTFVELEDAINDHEGGPDDV